MIVKICGVTSIEDALMVTESGADMIGLNFYKPSPRYITPSIAGEIVRELGIAYGEEMPVVVGVFVNMSVSDMTHIVNIAGLDFAQLSGDESAEVLTELRGVGYKALRPPNMALALDDVAYYKASAMDDERAPSFLLDAYHPRLYGGTGDTASVEVALAVKEQVDRLMLAGGLTPGNVAERVASIRPWGVDVASGVEPEGQPGVKSPEMVREFIQAAKSA